MCLATVSTSNSNLATALVARWNGTTWSLVPVPNPTGGHGLSLASVACSSTTTCTAVGGYQAGSRARLVAERWDGRSWSSEPMPNPTGGSGVTLTSVSCPSVKSCTAVGFFTALRTLYVTLAEHWDGRTWAVQQTQNLNGGKEIINQLESVSCPTPTDCMAVGYFNNYSGYLPLVEVWKGGNSWTGKAAPLPPDALFTDMSALSAVSCLSTTSCAAVGYYADRASSYTDLTLVDRWSGTGWSSGAAVSSPNPAGATGSGLSAVSCFSASMCIAVGQYSTSNSSLMLEELWNGRRWAIASMPVPPGATSQDLTAVACPFVTLCSATGSFTKSNGHGAGLIEHYGVPEGYFLGTADGHVYGAGSARSLGGISTTAADPLVSLAPTPDDKGYLLATRGGAVAAFGDASMHGDLGSVGVRANDIVAIASTADGRGYWLIGADGGMFAFGDAKYRGSLPALGLRVNDVVDVAATPSGAGYLIVGADGGTFAFGDAKYRGSLPALGVPVDDIRTLLLSVTGAGYLLVGSDGGVFRFGSGTPFLGSLPGEGIKVDEIVGLARTPDGEGYFIAVANGVVYGFGDAMPRLTPSGLAQHLPVTTIAGI